MNVLLYGAGVIGGQLVHALTVSGNEVSMVARGAWKDTLEQNGLRIRHYLQRKETTDHPRVLERPDNRPYDIAFAMMKFRQMERILDAMAGLNSPIIVLVGNNLSASEMERRILQASASPKRLLFGYGSSAGTRENGALLNAHTGDGSLTVGKAGGGCAGGGSGAAEASVSGQQSIAVFLR